MSEDTHAPAAERKTPRRADYLVAYDQRYADHLTQQFAKAVTEIAADLRRIADRVEREGKVRADAFGAEDPLPDHGQAAEQVQHAVLWGLANLGLDRLTARATSADRVLRYVAAADDGGER